MREEMPGHKPEAPAAIDQAAGPEYLYLGMPPGVIDQMPYVGGYGYLAGLSNVLLPGMTTSAPPKECPGVALGVCLCEPDAPFNVVDQPPVNMINKATSFVWPPCGECGAPAGGTHDPGCKFAGTGR